MQGLADQMFPLLEKDAIEEYVALGEAVDASSVAERLEWLSKCATSGQQAFVFELAARL